jgi:hypothetical protein
MSALAGLLGIGDATVEAGQEGQLHEAEVSAQDMGGGGDAGMQRSWSVESLAGLQQPSGLGGSAYDSQVRGTAVVLQLSALWDVHVTCTSIHMWLRIPLDHEWLALAS